MPGSIRWISAIVFFALFSLLLPAVINAADRDDAGKQDKSEKVEADYLGLAALLIQDDKYERAYAALQNVRLDKEGLDLQRFYTLSGLVNLKLSRFEPAVSDFLLARENGQDAPVIHVYLAQAWYALEKYPQALAAIEAAGETAAAISGMVLMQAQLQWELKQHDAAWATLQRGAERFSENPEFQRRQVFILIQLALYQSAASLGLDYLEHYDAGVEDYVAIGNALRQSGQAQAALGFLEPARMRFQQDEKAILALAHTYADLGRFRVAANLAEQVAIQNPEYLIDAAELYRRAGLTFRALFLNNQALDQKKKLKQRLALLLESELFTQAAGMEEALYRVGLTADEDIRYALAYAAFKTGDFERAESSLAYLTRPELFKKATALRKAMSACENERWRCL